jgi:predicted dehydrogenase
MASLVSAGTERTLVAFAEKSLLGKARSRPDLLRQLVDKARREGLLTTIEAAFNRLDQPMPLGYSSAGVVAALGKDVEGLKVGQRVACAGGNYAVHAEYAAVPHILITPIPDSVSFEQAAFTTLGAIAMHAFRLAQTQLGERVAVIGLGLLGLLCAGIARAAGCWVLGIDLDPQRVALAQAMGFEAVVRETAAEAASGFSRGRGCDAVLICADTRSDDPVQLAGEIARDRAHVVAAGAVGLNLPRKVYYEKELSFINSRSYGPGRYDPGYEEAGQDYPIGYVRWTEGRNLEAFVDLLASGRLDVTPLITHRFPIAEANEAYNLITGKVKEPFLGVLLAYPGPEAGDSEAGEAPLDLQAGGRDGSAPARVLAGALQPAPVPLPQSPPDIVRLGVLGAGSFATSVLLPSLKKVSQVELVGIVSASGMTAQHSMQRFAFRYAASSEEQILADPEINTVAVLTRHHLHARQTLAALRSGKNVFCEKPLALTEEELDEIARLLEAMQHYPLLTVGYNRRFAPLAKRMLELFRGRTEPLVALYRVNAGYIPLNHWVHDPAQGGGRINGEACHFVDFLSFLVGEPPLWVSAQGIPDNGRYAGDNVLLNFAFHDGSLGTVAYLANGSKAFPKERVEVFCGGRVAVLDDFRTLETYHEGSRQVFHSYLRQDKGHAGEWEAFSAAILAGGPPPIPYDHLIGASRAAFAALRSLRTGEKVEIVAGAA